MSLTRSIGLTQATAMVVGTIVGSSIFVQPSEVSRAVPTFAGMLLVWVVAGALTWFGASICAELTSALPRTGGVYVFLREMFSPAAGFLWGWAMFWSMHSGIIAAIAMVFARYVATIVPLGDLGDGQRRLHRAAGPNAGVVDRRQHGDRADRRQPDAEIAQRHDRRRVAAEHHRDRGDDA